MLFFTEVPEQTSLPLMIPQRIELVGAFVRSGVPIECQQPIWLMGITARFNWTETLAGSRIFLELESSDSQSSSNAPVGLTTIASPGPLDPGKYVYTGYIPINMAYGPRAGIIAKISGYTGTTPTFVELCYWFRKSMSRNPFNG